MSRLFIAAGREAGVGPGDIVGAIANETGIPARVIGNIDIYDNCAFVEVPAEYKDQVVEGMRGTTIHYRDVNMRPATTSGVAPSRPHKRAAGSKFKKKRHLQKGKKKGSARRK